MHFPRMVMEEEAAGEFGYDRIAVNLAESGIPDRALGDLGIDYATLKLPYGEHRGSMQLRRAIAEMSGGLGAECVITAAGAAGALFLIATALLDRDRHIVVVRPNYATNIATPNSLGAQITYIDLDLENGFRADPDAIARAVTSRTAYISLTTPHNPSGAVTGADDLQRIVRIAEEAGCYLLVDETYREIGYGAQIESVAPLSKNIIAVASMSKAYGVPGLRVGWAISQDAELRMRLLCVKEQISICSSGLDELVAAAILGKREEWLAAMVPHNRARRALIADWIANEPYVEWVEPQAGVVCFPRLNVPGSFDLERFYRTLIYDRGVYIGPGHWFDMPKRYFRLGFAKPSLQQLTTGLQAISAAIREQV